LTAVRGLWYKNSFGTDDKLFMKTTSVPFTGRRPLFPFLPIPDNADHKLQG